jgi:RNA polymerase sigma factor (sigma-70 family)
LPQALLYSDPELFARFQSGDEQAFTTIYDQTHFELFQYARRWLIDLQDAQDVTADTFVKLLNRRAQFSNIDSIIPFLKVTIKNGCLDILKHRKIQSQKEKEIIYQLSNDQEPDFGWVKAQETFLALIYEEVNKLSEKMREVFLLAYRDGLKTAEIAHRLNIKERTVTNQKLNAINLLKKAFANHPHILAVLVTFQAGTFHI